jgi:hypothetical protein
MPSWWRSARISTCIATRERKKLCTEAARACRTGDTSMRCAPQMGVRGVRGGGPGSLGGVTASVNPAMPSGFPHAQQATVVSSDLHGLLERLPRPQPAGRGRARAAPPGRAVDQAREVSEDRTRRARASRLRRHADHCVPPRRLICSPPQRSPGWRSGPAVVPLRLPPHGRALWQRIPVRQLPAPIGVVALSPRSRAAVLRRPARALHGLRPAAGAGPVLT